jgi:hypothetical protein
LITLDDGAPVPGGPPDGRGTGTIIGADVEFSLNFSSLSKFSATDCDKSFCSMASGVFCGIRNCVGVGVGIFLQRAERVGVFPFAFLVVEDNSVEVFQDFS